MIRKHDLTGRRVAVLATDGVEESEIMQPLNALRESGADVKIVSLPSTPTRIRVWAENDWGESIDVDTTVEDVSAGDFETLFIPGGVMSPDKLRDDDAAVEFVRAFFEESKPVAAICHGPWLLAEADVVKGRTLTSYSSIRTDLENAGADWRDESVIVDAGLVTSRNPGDLDAFVEKMLEEITEGKHAGQHA